MCTFATSVTQRGLGIRGSNILCFHHPVFNTTGSFCLKLQVILIHVVGCCNLIAFPPSSFCILQAVKNWTVGRPGNEAINVLLWTVIKLYICSPVIYIDLQNTTQLAIHTKIASAERYNKIWLPKLQEGRWVG